MYFVMNAKERVDRDTAQMFLQVPKRVIKVRWGLESTKNSDEIIFFFNLRRILSSYGLLNFRHLLNILFNYFSQRFFMYDVTITD